MKKSWKVLATIAAAAALVIAPLATTSAVASTAHVVAASNPYSPSPSPTWSPSPSPSPTGPALHEVTPTLTWTEPTCDAPGALTQSDEGVIWGAVLNDDDSTTYTASPAYGSTFPEDVQVEWTVPDLSQLSGDACVPQPKPVIGHSSGCSAPGMRTVTLTQTDWVWDATTSAWVLGQPVVTSTKTFYDVLCVVVVTPVPPVWVDECGPNNGHWTYPAEPVGYTYEEITLHEVHWLAIVPVLLDGYALNLKSKLIYHATDSNTPCANIVVVPTLFSAEPTAPSCTTAGALPDISGVLEHVTLAFDRPFDGPGTYVLTASTLEGFTFGDGTTRKTREITVAGAIATQSEDSAAPCYQAPPDLHLVPGDIGSECVGSVPYLGYALSLPEGYVAESDTPLTITFVNPTDSSQNYVVSNLPLSGTLLWPGASATAPLQWPGWEQKADGTYVETDGNYAWTRDGVTVLFEVNPSYQTTVTYPPESALCANPALADVPPSDPTDPRGPLASTGGADLRPWALGGLAVLMAGLALIFTRRAARR